jgi:hypothetical protein
MGKVIRRSAVLAVLVAAAVLMAPGAASASAALPSSFRCDELNHTSPCVKYCVIYDTRGEYPCGVQELPPQISGTYSFSAPMSAAQQNATGIPGDPGATGSTSITANASTNRLCATTSWSGIDSQVGAGHIHGGAAGQPENPGITIDLFPADLINGKTSPASGCTTIPPGMAWALSKCPAQFSLVVHSQNHPVGAIRGQLGTTCSVK